MNLIALSKESMKTLACKSLVLPHRLLASLSASAAQRAFAGSTLRPLLAAIVGLAALCVGCERPEHATVPQYVGLDACASCHPAETSAYRTSNHARAMEVATPESLLGDFSGSGLASGPAAAAFTLTPDGPRVRMPGAGGSPIDLPVAYTFGYRPLQQLLVPWARGRMQAFPVAWDSRPREEGGQRWFDVNSGSVASGDPLHWTGREQTWNYQCADCHSTNLRKGYDLATDAYSTTWSEVTVSCEACHGPGSRHVEWAAGRVPGQGERRDARAGRASSSAEAGLIVDLRAAEGQWLMRDPVRGIAQWSGAARAPRGEIDACARCHARRRPLVEPYVEGQPFADTHAPALLDEGLYHADGQILGEVYEWGSFAQSRMHRAGVTCSDCHDPHSGRLRAEGNLTCAPCHLPSVFDTPSHHHHAQGSPAAQCTACHMPPTTYMVVDPRHDHSMRIPRPDLSVRLGTPNACNGCHADRAASWAADAVASWFGARASERPEFATALDAGRRGLTTAERDLAALAVNAEHPAIARATALSLLSEYLSPQSLPSVLMALHDDDALVRAAAASCAAALPEAARVEAVAPHLADTSRAVRVAAASAISDVPLSLLAQRERAAFDASLAELVASELATAERPESHVNLSNLRARLGDFDAAETDLATARRLDPRFVPAFVNDADIARQRGDEARAERLLQEALQIESGNAAALHAMGLLRVRQDRHAEALPLLARAARAQPDNSRFAYVHALALEAAGDVPGAIHALRLAHERRPADRAVRSALDALAASAALADGPRAGSTQAPGAP